MNPPQRFVVRMIIFVVVVAVVCVILLDPLRRAYTSNYALNSLILGVMLIGIIYNFRQVMMIYPEMSWLERFRRGAPALSGSRNPKLLAPMARMLGEREKLSLSPMSMRYLLDGIASRLDESRELSRYTVGLLIFLGLLGTFWGLLETVTSIRDVINNLTIAGGQDFSTVFANLKTGLAAPLTGMGTSFSSSLFGLAGSLVLGFLDLQAGQAQNRFYNDLEEWLSSLTRLPSGALGGVGEGGDQAVPAYVQALLEQTAESLENLQRTLARGEERNIQAASNMVHLIERLGALGDLKTTLDRMARSGGGLDEATQTHIRNLDIYMARLLEELSSGRDDLIQQLRSEIKLLARTIAARGRE
jgi:hypothetical protein